MHNAPLAAPRAIARRPRAFESTPHRRSFYCPHTVHRCYSVSGRSLCSRCFCPTYVRRPPARFAPCTLVWHAGRRLILPCHARVADAWSLPASESDRGTSDRSGRGLQDSGDFRCNSVSSTLSIDSKFNGAATAANGLIVFAPFSADCVGVLTPPANRSAAWTSHPPSASAIGVSAIGRLPARRRPPTGSSSLSENAH